VINKTVMVRNATMDLLLRVIIEGS
jgi:hypothetical protein